MKRLLPLIFTLFSLTLFPAQAFAHSVLTDYHLVSDALAIQTTFSTGEALQGAQVVIYAPNNPTQPWRTGTTDQNGEFTFQPDRSLAGDWSIKIGAGDHGDILTIPVNDRGVDVDAISQAPYDSLHRFGKQMVIAGIVLAGIGTRWWMRWRHKK